MAWRYSLRPGILGVTRVEVRGRSMLPTYSPGDWLLALRIRPWTGCVVLVRDPRVRSRLILKRAVRRTSDGWWVEGDSPADSTDSRAFGSVPDALVEAVVVARYWPIRRGNVGKIVVE
ncbi:MAG: hypothetical protein U0990_05385 [Candidatus Nanopelagicales bacterium]|nr:hypothetical protein [Candidatus Nanopelagicales bacterium]MDZ4249506.1 hypothetical protein [Candidatus Nanopelagicales bacterium]